ncbi:MAG TPA: RNA polymerase factor sigma-54 [Verrucomicrobiales bacterium]|nr:RNA polymerase factor sigma-54 [Verrucomicrobiales bacterium]
MNTSQTLGQNLSQQQRLSPQLQQSLNILQAPVFELRQMIDQELEQNPVLEAEDNEVSLEEERPEAKLEDDDFASEFEKLSQMDEEWRTYLQQSAAGHGPRTSEEEERRQFIFDSLAAPVTLQDHLMQQLAMVECAPETRKLVEMLIGTLDDRGFLPVPIADTSLQQSIPLRDLAAAKEIVQSFDPAGVGAEDLRECLLIQLKRSGREHSLESRIITAHLDDLARHRFPHIARKLSVEPGDITRAAEVIATLNPRPASGFSATQQQFVVPDVLVERTGGKFNVVMDEGQLPRLRISNLYKDIMSNPGGGQDARDYIRDKIRSGKFLIRSIHQRQQTIQRIAEEIVSRQQEFFRHGPSALKPLIMSQVAEVVGVHETTVSRAIAGKYMATPHGVFEMRYFFTSGLATEAGEHLSNTSVKTTLAEMIRQENASEPLSDDDLATQLQTKGIKIARRTVAKYREALGILPSHLRRKF